VSNVALGVRVMGAKQVHDISVKVEIKGTKAVQTIPLKLSKGLNAYQEEINWNLIGVLNEVVFVVLPKSEQGPVAGTLYFSCAFLPKVAAPVQEAVVQTVTNAQAVAEVQASSRSFNSLNGPIDPQLIISFFVFHPGLSSMPRNVKPFLPKGQADDSFLP